MLKQKNKKPQETFVMPNAADLHSHILPAMDDGAKDEAETLAMLNKESDDGIRAVVATPHFYADREQDIASFLERREAACHRLLEVYQRKCHPNIFLGAEVAFFPGISSVEEIERLCIVGTNYILIEMPFIRWEVSDLKELCALYETRGLIPILAHIERYCEHQRPGAIDELLRRGILIQSNADCVIDKKSRKKIEEYYTQGKIHLLGSDCHNMAERSPNMQEGYAALYSLFGGMTANKIAKNGIELLKNATPL